MLLAALVAFVGTLIAFAGVTALFRGWLESRRGYLLTSAVTLLALTLGSGAATIGLGLDFGPTLGRAYQVGAALLAMLWLALSLVELVARGVSAAFVARLFTISFSIVAGVILAIDPLKQGANAGAFPHADNLYMQLPLRLLAAAHATVILIVAMSFIVVAVRAARGDEDAVDIFLACLLLVLAALFILVATRPELVSLPPLANVALLLSSAILIWVSAVRVMRVDEAYEEDEEDEEEEEDQFPEDPHLARRETGHGQEQPSRPPYAEPPIAERQTTQLTEQPRQPPPATDITEDAVGAIVIFTLREGAARPFDRLTATTVRAIHDKEPDTLLYTCHAVADAPQQRIFYELFRNKQAMSEHEQQPHVRRFMSEREQYVLATNVVRLKLNSQTGLPEPQPT